MSINKQFRVKHGLISDADVAVQGSVTATSFSGNGNALTNIDYTNLINKPTIPTVPTVVSAFTNDSGYITSSSLTGLASQTYVQTQIANLVASAPAALDTLKEIADQLAADESVASALASQVALKANTSSLATVAFSGSYNDLLNKPTIPTTTSQLTNNSGFLTSVAGSALTGTSLASTIVTSSLTTVGTLGSLSVTNNVTVGGQVIKSNLIGFRVYGSGTTNNLGTTVNTHGALTGNNFTVDFQQGTALNTTTGVFTAPTAGLYQVNIIVRNSGYTAGIMQAAVVKNAASGNGAGGSVQVMVEFAASSTMNHAGAGTIVKMAVGDTLALKVLAGQINFDSNDNWSVAFLG